MLPMPFMSSSGRLLISCLVPCWLSLAPTGRAAFRPIFLTMPVSTRRSLAGVESTTTRRTRRRLLTTLEAASAESDGIDIKLSTSKVKEDEPKNASTPPNKTKPAAKKPRKKSSPRSPSQTTRAPPAGWESTYALVEELRQDRTAPVDSDGSEALPDKTQGPQVFRFQVLIALMLSSQTKDAIVGETMRRLQQHGLTVENISQTPAKELDAMIFRVGFHNNKTKYIKQTVEILKERYDGDIPPNAVEMMELPGVGPKMAFIVENVAWNRVTGIGLDTHMHRMFNQLKWVSSKNPEQTRKQLESWLPKDRWPTVNVLWVGFGQEVQQQKPKIIRKALDCSRPVEALRLLKRLGVDLAKEGAKMGAEEEIKQALKG